MEILERREAKVQHHRAARGQKLIADTDDLIFWIAGSAVATQDDAERKARKGRKEDVCVLRLCGLRGLCVPGSFQC